jgi:quinol monooxygenase YgiN
VHAHFADWRAFKDHAETAHLKRVLPRINALLAAPIAMEIYLEV